MTDRVNPSTNATATSWLTAAAIAYGATDSGWVQTSGVELYASDVGLTGTPLNAFNHASSSGLDVTIDTGEGFVQGAYVATDDQHTVTLADNTSNQSVYVGYDRSQGNTVIVGLSSAFASVDPKMEVWQFDTSGGSVTSSTDQRTIGRNLGSFEAFNRKYDSNENGKVDAAAIDAHQSSHLSTGSDTIDAGNLGGGSGSNGQVLVTDGTNANWQTQGLAWQLDGTKEESAQNSSYTLNQNWDIIKVFLKIIQSSATANPTLSMRFNDSSASDYTVRFVDGSVTSSTINIDFGELQSGERMLTEFTITGRDDGGQFMSQPQTPGSDSDLLNPTFYHQTVYFPLSENTIDSIQIDATGGTNAYDWNVYGRNLEVS